MTWPWEAREIAVNPDLKLALRLFCISLHFLAVWNVIEFVLTVELSKMQQTFPQLSFLNSINDVRSTSGEVKNKSKH